MAGALCNQSIACHTNPAQLPTDDRLVVRSPFHSSIAHVHFKSIITMQQLVATQRDDEVRRRWWRRLPLRQPLIALRRNDERNSIRFADPLERTHVCARPLLAAYLASWHVLISIHYAFCMYLMKALPCPKYMAIEQC